MIRSVAATRYVTPLREGGSLPAIVEADDLGLYVLKFRGAVLHVAHALDELLAFLVLGEPDAVAHAVLLRLAVVQLSAQVLALVVHGEQAVNIHVHAFLRGSRLHEVRVLSDEAYIKHVLTTISYGRLS